MVAHGNNNENGCVKMSFYTQVCLSWHIMTADILGFVLCYMVLKWEHIDICVAYLKPIHIRHVKFHQCVSFCRSVVYMCHCLCNSSTLQ